MKVEIAQLSVRRYEVIAEGHGLVGHIYDFSARPFKFKYVGDRWMKLTYAENAAVLAAVEPKLTLLNITKRLQG